MAFALAFLMAFLIAGTLGSKRKIGFWWSLLACLFATPIGGLIITLCSDKLPPEDNTPLTEILTEAREHNWGDTENSISSQNFSDNNTNDVDSSGINY